MHALRPHGVSYSDLWAYILQWTFPKQTPNLAHVFDATNVKAHYKNKHFNSTASELLSILPVLLRFFVMLVLPLGLCTDQVHSIIACLEVVEMLLMVRKDGVSPEDLHRYIVRHLHLFLDAYAEGLWRPKHHYAWHLPQMLKRFGTLIACFTHERKHRLIKRFGQHRRNTKSYEQCLLEEVTVYALLHLDDYSRVNAHKPVRKILASLKRGFQQSREFRIAHIATGSDGQVVKGDVVALHMGGARQVGEVLHHVLVDPSTAQSILNLRALESHNHCSSQYIVSDQVVVVSTSAIGASMVYSKTGSRAIVLNPPNYR